MLQAGTKAPDFTLPDKDGKMVSLSDFLGKKVVLHFYPKDNTPGCTRQACAFAAANEGFRTKNVEVIGISKDSIASQAKFAEKHGLPFVLLSDPDLVAIQAYGVWQEKKRRRIRDNIYSPEDANLYHKTLQWFLDNLPQPPFYGEDNDNPQGAITWFKTENSEKMNNSKEPASTQQNIGVKP